MAITLNQNRCIYELDDAYKKVVALKDNIYNESNVQNIINSELYYILKYKEEKNKITRNMVLCEFVKKVYPYIKTPEIKKIISYVKHISNFKTFPDLDKTSWFLLNIEKGYVPTPAVIEAAVEILPPEFKLKLFELYPNKIQIKTVFNTNFLINDVFNTNDIKIIDEFFGKFKIKHNEIVEIIKNNGFNDLHNHYSVNNSSHNKTINYIYNIFNYMIEKNIKLESKDLVFIMNNNAFINHQFTLNDFQIDILKKIKTIMPKLNSSELTEILIKILNNSCYIKSNIIFIKNFCQFEKFNENNIMELIKNFLFNNFPFELFTHFYEGDINSKIMNLLFVIKNNSFVLNFIKILNDNYNINDNNNNNINNQQYLDTDDDTDDDIIEDDENEDDEEDDEDCNKNKNTKIKPTIPESKTFMKDFLILNDTFDLDALKKSIKVSLNEMFEMAFKYGSVPVLDYFLNNKYVITEDMVLKNFSRELFNILNTCSKKGFYVTEKCFDHLLLNILISGGIYDTKKIQNVSIYVNDDEDFLKFKKNLDEKWEQYNKLTTIFDDLKTTIDYLTNKKVTNEMLILSNSRIVRAYLINRMEEEKIISESNTNNQLQSTPQTVKKVKKVIVKKIVKKSTNNI